MSLKTLLPVALIAATLCAAEDPQATFKATTRLVEFTVVALDKKGAPVTDLSKDQFTVLDNGNPRPIAFFRYEGVTDRRAAAEPTPAPLPHGTLVNRLDMGGSPVRNVTALVLDGLNTDVNDQAIVKAHMLRFLKTLAPRTRVAIFQLGPGLRVVHDFTDDMESLRAALDKAPDPYSVNRLTDIQRMAAAADEIMDQAEAKKRYSIAPIVLAQLTKAMVGEMNVNSRLQAERMRATLALIDSIGRHMSGIAGRKNLVWISSGLSIAATEVGMPQPGQTNTRINPAAGRNFERQVRAAGQRLAAQGVALYAVDAHGLVSSAERLSEMQEPPPARSGRFGEIERAAAWNQDPRGTFTVLTTVTGGRSFFNTNDLAAPIKQAANDQQGCYSIGFYVPEEPDGKWHALKASVDAAGVELRHRAGYAIGIPEKPEAGRKTAEALLLDPLGTSAIGMLVRAVPAPGGTVDLSLQIKTDDLSFSAENDRRRGEIAIFVADISAKGNASFHEETVRFNFTPEQFEIARRKNIPYHLNYTPAANTVLIRALVLDNAAGRAGTVDIPIAAVHP